jgi:hypothetical protein
MIYILTGMHRSGTSMFARFMNESGINMGTDFYVDETANKYGHFEDLDFLNLQRTELAHQFNGEDYLIYDDFPISLDFVKNAKQLLIKKDNINGEKPWGWKDPRTTVFLNYWHALNRETKYIFMVRKPTAVVNSLCRLLKTKWSFTEKSRYLKTYIFYNRELLLFLKKYQGKNMILIGFEELIENPERTLGKASENIQFNFDNKLFSNLFDDQVISDSQGISYIFLKDLLAGAEKTYLELSKYF